MEKDILEREKQKKISKQNLILIAEKEKNETVEKETVEKELEIFDFEEIDVAYTIHEPR